MQLLFMNQWLPAGLMKAICWTLVHSLWQGLILAALAGLLMMGTKKQTAAFRYNMLAILFLVFMSVATGTFVIELNTAAPAASVENYQFSGGQVVQPPHEALLPLGAGLEANTSEVYIERFTGYFNEHATLLVTIWFIIFLAKALKLVSGLAYIQRVRHYKISQPAAYWGNRVKELAAVLGVQVPVQLLESGLVTVPMVTGILKPLILVPAGLMANLPPEQIEAILLHELAHIRRRDFLVNLAQSFAETLFFFNPAVLWLSALLREEREHCCDDMAIGVTQSRKQYVHALVSFQEYQNNTPYAMAFPGKKNQLLNRVKRIVNNHNKTLNLTEKTFLVVCIGLIMLLSMVVTRPAIAQDTLTNKEQQLPDTLAREEESAPDEPGTPVELSDGVDEVATEEGGAAMDNQPATEEPGRPDTIPAVTLNATKPPYETWCTPYQAKVEPIERGNYMQPFEPVNQAYVPYPGKYGSNDTVPVLHKGTSVMSGVITLTRGGKEYKITVDHNRLVGLVIDGKLIPNEALSEYFDDVNAIFRSMEAEEMKLKGEKVKEEAVNAQRKAAEADRKRDEQIRLNLQHVQLLSQTKLNSNLGAQGALGGKLHPQGKLGLLKTDSLLRKTKTIEQNSSINDIIDELVASGIATSTDPLSFRINREEVVVNNVKVPIALQVYFQDKYIMTPKDSYVYSKEGNRTSSTVTLDR